MLVYPIRPISPVTPVVRSQRSDETEEPDDVQPLPVRKTRPRSAKREGKAFFQSASERSSAGVQAALIALPRGG